MKSLRFQIEELLSQNANGAVFLAFDNETEQEVLLQRFFPFGPEEDGLQEDEREAYDRAISKMKELESANLRRVVDGGTDSVDGMPFLVTEMRSGISMGDFLQHSTLSPVEGRLLLESALELMIWLEQRFGQTADWLALQPDDVEYLQESQTFRFCLDPMKWLGLQPGKGATKELGALMEQCMGWSGRVVTASAANALSTWVRAAKTKDLTSAQALVLLREGTLTTASSPVAAKLQAKLENTPQPESQPADNPRPALATPGRGNGIWYVLGSVAAALAVAAGGFLWHQARKQQSAEPVLAINRTAASVQTEEKSASFSEERKLREAVEKRAREMQEEASVSVTLPQPQTVSKVVSTSASKGDYLPENVRGITAQMGKEISMMRKVTNVRLSESRESLYIEFEGAGNSATRVRGRYMTKHEAKGMTLDELIHLKGKKVRIRGIVVTEPLTKRVLIDLTSLSQIEVVEE